eukprot:1187935-Prorocentrum_minimum.AAC.2
MSFFDKLADFASTIAETGREAHHMVGLDKVGLGNEMYVEDDATSEVRLPEVLKTLVTPSPASAWMPVPSVAVANP